MARRILDAHPRIHCGPEIKFFRDFYGDYFHDPLQHLRFATTARAVLSEDELFELLGAAFVRLHERAADRVDKPRWADKNPENILYLEQWQRLLGDEWLLVHVVRNPLDTLASVKDVGFPLSIPAGLDARIDMYRRYVELGLSFAARYPERYFRVVYEQLVSEPRATLVALMEWLGEQFDPVQLAFNQVPHQSGLEDPNIETTPTTHARSAGRWASVLDAHEVALIWSQTRDLVPQMDPAGSFASALGDPDRLNGLVAEGLLRAS